MDFGNVWMSKEIEKNFKKFINIKDTILLIFKNEKKSPLVSIIMNCHNGEKS